MMSGKDELSDEEKLVEKLFDGHPAAPQFPTAAELMESAKGPLGDILVDAQRDPIRSAVVTEIRRRGKFQR